MEVVNDPQEIKIRSGMQVQRDQVVVEIAFFVQDLFENIQGRKTAKVKILTNGDVNLLTSLVESLANIHFYLQYENRWVSASQQKKDLLNKLAVEQILRLIVKSSTPIADELALSVTGILEENFNKVF